MNESDTWPNYCQQAGDACELIGPFEYGGGHPSHVYAGCSTHRMLWCLHGETADLLLPAIEPLLDGGYVLLGSYWIEQQEDPANYCSQRGEYPHPGCEIGMYEGGGPWSQIYGACHGHKTIWHLQSGGEADPTWRTLAELDGKGYVDVTPH